MGVSESVFFVAHLGLETVSQFEVWGSNSPKDKDLFPKGGLQSGRESGHKESTNESEEKTVEVKSGIRSPNCKQCWEIMSRVKRTDGKEPLTMGKGWGNGKAQGE